MFINLKFALFLINFYFYFRVVIVRKNTVEGGEERLGGKGNWMIFRSLTLFLMHKPV